MQKAAEIQPDVMILDIGLPGIDGYRVAEMIRHQDALHSTFLVALTGYAQAEDQQRSRQAGFDRHLVKPVEFEVLRQILEDL